MASHPAKTKRLSTIRRRNVGLTHSQLRNDVESGQRGSVIQRVERKHNGIGNRRYDMAPDSTTIYIEDVFRLPRVRQGSQFSVHPPETPRDRHRAGQIERAGLFDA